MPGGQGPRTPPGSPGRHRSSEGPETLGRSCPPAPPAAPVPQTHSVSAPPAEGGSDRTVGPQPRAVLSGTRVLGHLTLCPRRGPPLTAPHHQESRWSPPRLTAPPRPGGGLQCPAASPPPAKPELREEEAAGLALTSGLSDFCPADVTGEQTHFSVGWGVSSGSQRQPAGPLLPALPSGSAWSRGSAVCRRRALCEAERDGRGAQKRRSPRPLRRHSPE